jgi:UDPglucose--hexose-1-phosphate uridylyltransferase
LAQGTGQAFNGADMSEYRHDPLTGQWVIIATNRGQRPDEFAAPEWKRVAADCPFCTGQEHETPPEVARFQLPVQNGWQVRVIPNKFPAVLSPPPALNGAPHGLPGLGVHEVVIESPRHVTSLTHLAPPEVALVLAAYAQRLAALLARGDLAYGLVFKNVGAAAGASLEHVHSQVVGTALLPPVLDERRRNWQQSHARSGKTVAAEFLDQELAAHLRIVGQTRNFVAVAPFASRVPFELRILPLAHRAYFEELSSDEAQDLGLLLLDLLTRLESCIAQSGYNLIIHTAPFDTSRHDYYHWHIEILPRLTRTAGFEWGTGCFINPLAPEDAARRLRDA